MAEDDDYSHKLAMLKLAMGGAVRGYDGGGSVQGNPEFVPGLGMIDPMTGAPMPNYMSALTNPQGVAAGQSPPASVGVGQTWTPQQQAPQQPQPQQPPQQA